MSTAAKTRVSAAEFALRPASSLHRSLVRREVVETTPPNARRGIVAIRFGVRLDRWATETGSGIVGVESGFILDRDPDTVRGPDVYFVRADRVPPEGAPDTFRDLAPDLAVEVVSPSETANEVREKVQDYLAAGTPLVVAIYPKTRELVAHTPDGLARTYRADEIFTAPAILPGFACRVAGLSA